MINQGTTTSNIDEEINITKITQAEKALQRCQRHLNELRKLEQTDFASGLNLGILENRLNLEHILSEEERRLQAYILRNKLEINGD